MPGYTSTTGPGHIRRQTTAPASGRRSEGNDMYGEIYDFLTLTVADGLNSVAIPALNCEEYGVPSNATTTIVSAVNDFCENEPSASKLTEVYFVDNQQEFVDQFNQSLQLIVGDELSQLSLWS